MEKKYDYFTFEYEYVLLDGKIQLLAERGYEIISCFNVPDAKYIGVLARKEYSEEN